MAHIPIPATPLDPQNVTENGGLAPASPADVPELTPEQLAAMSPEEKDRWWFRNVYQGDKMPQLTLRAVLVGGILGMLMSASNLYTTLTIGWAFGVAITACVMSYVFWNILRAVTGVSQMSILENNCMQSTASAAGYSTGSTIATMFGALLLLQTGDSEKIRTFDVQPIWLVAIFTLCTGLMGVLLAIPMKRQMINHEQLPFPSGIASAETLRSLYSQSKEAVHKAYSLVISLAAGAFIGIINTDEDTAGKIRPLARTFAWFKERLFNIQLKGQYPESGIFHFQGKQLIDSGFQPSVLLIGAGMITGLRVSLSMLAGSLLLYAFVAPQILAMDAARAGEEGFKPSIELVAGGTVFHVYRWALWGGTGLMVFSSLTSLAMQWKTIGLAFTKSREEASHGERLDDAAMKALEVPGWWMIAGMVPVAIAMLILQIVAFNISWYAGLIAIALSFVLSLVACRATGETDTTPIGAMGKVMQLTFALLHPGQIVPNLASAGIAANSASSSADLLTDLKSGYLLGANPRKQFLAQFFGVFFGTVAIVPIWYLMVPTKAVMEKFPAPGTQSWYRIAKVLTEGLSSLPNSAKYALIGGCFVGILLPLVERFVVPARYRKYWPSAMGLGLSWVVPFASAFSFAIGAVISFVWSRVHKKSEGTFNVPIASGLIAGESLMKALIAMTATAIGIFTSK